ncbi:hypothetical protein K1719_012463 [Acacia pycnantha]|nr:hypothetical protein K1719_012463 [Acacia pycnantha]
MRVVGIGFVVFAGAMLSEQPEVQGPGVWISTERGATDSPVEYSDVSAYRLSLSEDTKALNQLVWCYGCFSVP